MGDEKRKDRCETCRFWEPSGQCLDHVEPVELGAMGYCHRYPPAFQDKIEDHGGWDTWPHTNLDDWCGEYQPKQS